MKARYAVDRELIDGRDAPVVTDRRRPQAHQVICFTVGISVARRIARALNQDEQRRLWNKAVKA